MTANLIAQLLEPVPGDDIGGSDIAFEPVIDEIREARRQDDPALAQGDWETEIKTAHWPRVRELAEDVLAHRSKDLQVAAWYAEAMTRLQGFAGLSIGLGVLDGLVNDFWAFCYPTLDPDDLEERASKIEWLNRQLPLAIREIPLTERAAGGYSWLKWEESRSVDNLGLKDVAARDKAVAEGKLAGDAFDKAVQASGRAFYEKLHGHIAEAVSAAAILEKRVDERFGADAPSLKDLRHALRDCADLVGKLLARVGGATQPAAPAAAQPNLPQQGTSMATPIAATAPQAIGHLASRSDAIRALREAARYFRHNEPHSPVALLAERAANWAEMPLEQWLSSVIKDEGTLGQLRELLDIRPPAAS